MLGIAVRISLPVAGLSRLDHWLWCLASIQVACSLSPVLEWFFFLANLIVQLIMLFVLCMALDKLFVQAEPFVV